MDKFNVFFIIMLCVRIAAIFYVECVAVLTITWSYVRIAVIVYKKLKKYGNPRHWTQYINLQKAVETKLRDGIIRIGFFFDKDSGSDSMISRILLRICSR